MTAAFIYRLNGQFSPAEIAGMRDLSYVQLAGRVMAPFCNGEIDEGELTAMAGAAYAGFDHPAIAPLVQLDDTIHILELFHGPTIAFKDYAMQFLARAFDRALANKSQQAVNLGATSGDTGSAALEAFQGRGAIDVFILFPDGRVSPVQQRQMTSVIADGAHAVSIKGDFDDCQALVKALFNDLEFRDEVNLSAVNSINWARLMPQIVYYFSSAVSLGAPSRKVSFTVPTGNFGDIFAGYIAKEVGLPIDRLVVATNQNDILHRCLSGNGYYTTEVAASISPSMDIQISSNFERALFYAYALDANEIAKLMDQLKQNGGFDITNAALSALSQHYSSGMATEVETSNTIERSLSRSAQLLCPHTAIGVKVADDFRDHAVPMITLATAHPAKFPAAVKNASEVNPSLPDRMSDLFDRSERISKVANDPGELKRFIN